MLSMLSAFLVLLSTQTVRSHFSFFCARKPIVSGFNRSEGCDSFCLIFGHCLLSYHVRGTEFSFLAELDVGERHFEAIAGKTAEEAKKTAAVAALQALKLRNRPWLRLRQFRPFRPGTFVVGLNAKHVKMQSK